MAIVLLEIKYLVDGGCGCCVFVISVSVTTVVTFSHLTFPMVSNLTAGTKQVNLFSFINTMLSKVKSLRVFSPSVSHSVLFVSSPATIATVNFLGEKNIVYLVVFVNEEDMCRK